MLWYLVTSGSPRMRSSASASRETGARSRTRLVVSSGQLPGHAAGSAPPSIDVAQYATAQPRSLDPGLLCDVYTSHGQDAALPRRNDPPPPARAGEAAGT